MNKNLTLEQKVELLMEKYEDALLRAERAEAYGQILKVWAAHAYCYRAQRQRYEIENYWAKEHDDIMYAHGEFAFYGKEVMTAYYAAGNEIMNEGKLKLMHELWPDVENIPENLGIGDLVIRCQTTPYIEVAGDAKTAKGIFYTLGFNTENDREGKMIPMFMIGKDAVDFIKESDGWKIWHYRDSGDFGFSIPTEIFERQPNMASRTVDGAFPAFNRTLEPFPETGGFTTKRVAKMSPELPQPYSTWTDDMSWAKAGLAPAAHFHG